MIGGTCVVAVMILFFKIARKLNMKKEIPGAKKRAKKSSQSSKKNKKKSQKSGESNTKSLLDGADAKKIDERDVEEEEDSG